MNANSSVSLSVRVSPSFDRFSKLATNRRNDRRLFFWKRMYSYSYDCFSREARARDPRSALIAISSRTSISGFFVLSHACFEARRTSGTRFSVHKGMRVLLHREGQQLRNLRIITAWNVQGYNRPCEGKWHTKLEKVFFSQKKRKIGIEWN